MSVWDFVIALPVALAWTWWWYWGRYRFQGRKIKDNMCNQDLRRMGDYKIEQITLKIKSDDMPINVDMIDFKDVDKTGFLRFERKNKEGELLRYSLPIENLDWICAKEIKQEKLH